jgi:nucleotide-binding universal stress UspA family protein
MLPTLHYITPTAAAAAAAAVVVAGRGKGGMSEGILGEILPI